MPEIMQIYASSSSQSRQKLNFTGPQTTHVIIWGLLMTNRPRINQSFRLTNRQIVSAIKEKIVDVIEKFLEALNA
jgi:hypothetical protein